MSVTTFTVVGGQMMRQVKDGVVHDFVPDPLGSVVMVQDSAGAAVYKAEYDPYGNVQSETGINPSSLGYVGTLGYIKDSATSMYVRARYLLSNLGRWLTKDPLWPSEAGYVYVGAIPVKYVDPSGKQWLRGIPFHEHFHPCLKDPLGCFNEAFCPDPDGFWSSGTWGYGNCCGFFKRCNSGSSTNGTCADLACRAHDECAAGPSEVMNNWFGCSDTFCSDLMACWNSECSGSVINDPRQCRAIQNIAAAFCNTRWTGKPGDLGKPWSPPPPPKPFIPWWREIFNPPPMYA